MFVLFQRKSSETISYKQLLWFESALVASMFVIIIHEMCLHSVLMSYLLANVLLVVCWLGCDITCVALLMFNLAHDHFIPRTHCLWYVVLCASVDCVLFLLDPFSLGKLAESALIYTNWPNRPLYPELSYWQCWVGNQIEWCVAESAFHAGESPLCTQHTCNCTQQLNLV